jgi:hypothetical protein
MRNLYSTVELKEEINIMREELNRLLLTQTTDSEVVGELSRRIDKLIYSYLKLQKPLCRVG